MFYFTTGGTGAGKTLNTLWDVRQLQVETGRSVYYNGFDMDPAKAAEFGWKECDPTKWQDLPDGSIVIWDECQRPGHLPTRGSGAHTPEYISKLAEHRKRGFDFFLISQHPLNVDKFVTRLIDNPGWHRHLKRVGGADMVSELKWRTVYDSPQKSGAAKSAAVRMFPYRKEVYSWYKSTSLDTTKGGLPRVLYVFAACLIALPLFAWFGYKQVAGYGAKAAPVEATSAPLQSGTVPGQKPDYFAGYVPRVEGLPHTAPRYDEVTKPVTAPYPAACVDMGKRCGCYSQQGTALDTPAYLCREIVKKGYFMDWDATKAPTSSQAAAPSPTPVQVAAAAPAADSGPWAVSMGGEPRGQAAGTSATDGKTLASMKKASSAAH